MSMNVLMLMCSVIKEYTWPRGVMVL